VVRRRVLVSGRVQGVFFRASLREVAVEHGLAGVARNLADGRVEAVLEGSPVAVEAVIAWCRHGPPRARVTAVEVIDEPFRGEKGFAVG
jgi:acylphosphatase